MASHNGGCLRYEVNSGSESRSNKAADSQAGAPRVSVAFSQR